MNSTSGNYENGNLPIQNREGEKIPGKINLVPNELLRLIFSQLDNMDSTAASFVTKLWKVEVYNVVKEEKQLALLFVNALISNLQFIAKNPDDYETMGLDKYEILNVKSYNKYLEDDEKIKKIERDQKNIDQTIMYLTALINETKNDEPLNLIKFKETVLNIFERILDSLTSFDDDLFIKVLAMTKNEALPSLWKIHFLSDSANVRNKDFDTVFGNLFAAKKEMEKVMTFPYGLRREPIMNIAATLAQSGHLDRALEYALQIPNGYEFEESQDDVLQYICKALIVNKYFDKAIEVANLINDPDIQAEALDQIKREMNL